MEVCIFILLKLLILLTSSRNRSRGRAPPHALRQRGKCKTSQTSSRAPGEVQGTIILASWLRPTPDAPRTTHRVYKSNPNSSGAEMARRKLLCHYPFATNRKGSAAMVNVQSKWADRVVPNRDEGLKVCSPRTGSSSASGWHDDSRRMIGTLTSQLRPRTTLLPTDWLVPLRLNRFKCTRVHRWDNAHRDTNTAESE